jgi:hypothetical protein
VDRSGRAIKSKLIVEGLKPVGDQPIRNDAERRCSLGALNSHREYRNDTERSSCSAHHVGLSSPARSGMFATLWA